VIDLDRSGGTITLSDRSRSQSLQRDTAEDNDDEEAIVVEPDVNIQEAPEVEISSQLEFCPEVMHSLNNIYEENRAQGTLPDGFEEENNEEEPDNDSLNDVYRAEFPGMHHLHPTNI
jgi:hypothetical protein